jgi:hypothetical protein
MATCREFQASAAEECEIPSREELLTERDRLIARLEQGGQEIEAARAKGRDVARWEDFWINLLHRYERICDRLDRLS